VRRIFAVPTSGGLACAHFGHCEGFTVLEEEAGSIADVRFVSPPAHEPGSYPRFLAELGVHVVLAGGIGGRARDLLRQNGIEVLAGVTPAEPAVLVQQYLADSLDTGGNLCDHGNGEGHGHDHRCRD
jgi:predicted Fe-Mo cluster-binding NifX family protein